MKQQKARWKQEQRQRWRRVRKQHRAANARKKYGPRRKPNPVTIIRPGEAPITVDQNAVAKPRVADSLEARARDAGFLTYAAYLRSRDWQDRRRRVLSRDGWRCVRCRSKRNLHVHHRWYSPLGAEPLKSLETLCEKCHKRVHR